MRTILYVIQKEFLQISRNKMMLPIIFVIPLVQLIILVNAATMEIKNINLCIVDKDLSSISRQIKSKFQGAPFYKIRMETFSMNDAEKSLTNGTIDAIIHIPAGFEEHLIRNNNAKLQININAINGVVAGITMAYMQGIFSDLNQKIIVDFNGKSTLTGSPETIQTTYSYWYNPQLNYKNFMVPAILVILVTMIGMFLSGLNLVREKEMGTIEQINVTPIRKYQFIIGKLVPFWIIGLIELTVGLILGKFIFNIPIVGHLSTLYFIAAIYLLVVLGLGLLVSTMANTQQQAMFVTFFIMLVCVMMSGIFTAVESMPEFAQQIDLINPIYYFMRSVRMILLKGSGIPDLLPEILSLLGIAIGMLSLAVWRYRKTA
jgi:ABC-2 type transport system permease protein